MIEFRHKELFSRFISRKITEEEFKELRKESITLTDSEIERDFEQAWLNYVADPTIKDVKLEYPSVITHERKLNRSLRIMKLVAGAAAMILLATSLYQLDVFEGSDTMTQPLITHITEPMNRSKVILPDGSTIELNNASTLSYPIDFGTSNREIALDGEAFFEVESKKNSEKLAAFVVNANNFKVTVTGTKFNVTSRKDCDKATVTLVEGSVNINTDAEPDKTIMLTANQKAIINTSTGKVDIAESNPEYELAWLNSEYLFSDDTLEDVLSYLAINNGVEFKIEGLPSDKRFTGRFSEESIEEILDVIALHYDFEYSRVGRVITLKFKNI